MQDVAVDRSRIGTFVDDETVVFRRRNPRSARLAEQARQHMPDGVPLHWMTDWETPFPLFIASARDATLIDVDGNSYADFCLGDTGAMTGHAPSAVVAASAGGRGFTHMLPSEDAVIVAGLLAARFDLPFWQFAATATDANRFAIRWARGITGRATVLVFDGCYHGTVDDSFVVLKDGKPAMKPGLIGQAYDLTAHSRVVPFNDEAALAAALEPGDVAVVLTEPVLTNCGMVPPARGFLDAARRLTRQHGTLLHIDETHTISTGPGGYTQAHRLEPDFVTLGKPVAGGIPAAAYGFTAAVAERIAALRARTPPGHSGIGTTLAAGALAMAAMRATLEKVLTPDAYGRMRKLANKIEVGLVATLGRHGLPWCVCRVGARLELQYRRTPPRDAAEAAAAFDHELAGAIRLGLLNRGVVITPFHNMLLVGPATSSADVDRLLGAFAEVLAELFGEP